MRVRIHRGAEEIGGNCVELESGGSRILLDLGRPLEAGLDEDVELPAVQGLAKGDDPNLLGVVVSHPHLDHWGLVPRAAASVPVWMGEAASRILREAAFFSPAGAELSPAGFLRDRRPFELGPFRVTPLLMDHSAFDAYALLVEAGGKRLFYSGDFRAHGRKGALFERLLRAPPKGVDVLLVEGTNVRPDGVAGRGGATESDVERRCIETFRATPGMALVSYSAQNIDRLVTLYRAALQADRDFVMDLYTATVARATGCDSIPRPGPGWERVRLYVTEKQRRQVKASGQFERVERWKAQRIYRPELAANSRRFVTTFRAGMGPELAKDGCLEGAGLVWSLWDGYLELDRGLRRFLETSGVPMTVHHASGHATAGQIEALIAAIRPGLVVPIHTQAAARMAAAGPGRTVRANGEWWEV